MQVNILQRMKMIESQKLKWKKKNLKCIRMNCFKLTNMKRLTKILLNKHSTALGVTLICSKFYKIFNQSKKKKKGFNYKNS